VAFEGCLVAGLDFGLSRRATDCDLDFVSMCAVLFDVLSMLRVGVWFIAAVLVGDDSGNDTTGEAILLDASATFFVCNLSVNEWYTLNHFAQKYMPCKPNLGIFVSDLVYGNYVKLQF
jgi:hypothetical protein